MENDFFSPAVILSTRVRLARNLVDYPFPPVLDKTGRTEIIEKVGAVAKENGFVGDEKLSDSVYAESLAEDHKISREFAAEKEAHALFTNAERGTSVMVCEEDHLRIQSFANGFALDTACREALEAERIFNEKLRFAFDPSLGYLTHCPTNLGTAMRASVLAFLPALTLAGRIPALKAQLEKVGMTLRGMYGESSNADAFLYQISNQCSLGLSEKDLVHKVDAVVRRIAQDELSLRENLLEANRDTLTDKICRALGTLRYAFTLTSKEFLECYAYVRLGISLRLLTDVDIEDLDALLPEVMPAHILYNAPDTGADPAQRDKLRAGIVRKRL